MSLSCLDYLQIQEACDLQSTLSASDLHLTLKASHFHLKWNVLAHGKHQNVLDQLNLDLQRTTILVRKNHDLHLTSTVPCWRNLLDQQTSNDFQPYVVCWKELAFLLTRDALDRSDLGQKLR